MIITKLTDEYIEDEEIYALFPEFYMGYSSKGFDSSHASWETKGVDEGYSLPKVPLTEGIKGKGVNESLAMIDEELGLEIVAKETVYEKYGIKLDPNKNSFHKSLYDQFELKGYLSSKQVSAIKNSRN